MNCTVNDDTRIDFALGEAADLDEHIETCDECQDFLESIWSGELEKDLSVPVLNALKMQQFFESLLGLGADLAEDFGRATLRYGAGPTS